MDRQKWYNKVILLADLSKEKNERKRLISIFTSDFCHIKKSQQEKGPFIREKGTLKNESLPDEIRSPLTERKGPVRFECLKNIKISQRVIHDEV